VIDWLQLRAEVSMGGSFEDWGWTTITADDALSGRTFQISYQSFTESFRVNGVNVERTKMFETPGESTVNTLTFQGEGIIAHLKLIDLQRLLN
jgi:hypothetical protein